MQQLILLILGVPAFITAFYSVTIPVKWLDFKPFNCNVCLSFWLVLFGGLYLTNVNVLLSILAAGIAAYMAIILKRIIFRI